MVYTFKKHTSAGSNGTYLSIFAILFIASLTGCAAMEGVNVGANIPLGGVVNVGASKTIGDGRSTKSRKKKGDTSQKDQEEQEEEQEEQEE